MKALVTVAVIGLSRGTAGARAKDKDKDKGKDKRLPPGREKKLDNGGDLPPGWQKPLRKGDILARDIYRRGTVIKSRDSDGLISNQDDDTVVRFV
ncbi:hypothetical protein, partial [Pseudoalteromonas sp. S1649]|uniref:hypothetical protein n=1 Tax=Pseudoalteromonas sp. S1649 TaxID=579508 RepID=UPI00110BCBEC